MKNDHLVEIIRLLIKEAEITQFSAISLFFLYHFYKGF
jgi:hypothetical protein